jgi:multiple sugar transport system substrate-binding protein
MKQRALWSAVLLAGLALAGCGSASDDLAKKHPGVTVDFLAQPFERYYTLLGAALQSGKGPDVMLINGGGQIRDRVDALLPWDGYVGDDKQRLAGWDAFTLHWENLARLAALS